MPTIPDFGTLASTLAKSILALIVCSGIAPYLTDSRLAISVPPSLPATATLAPYAPDLLIRSKA